jgi:hypothetical protein
MGTSDCALLFFKTQDVVPEGKEDTPLNPLCQMPYKPGFRCLNTVFILYIQYLMFIIKFTKLCRPDQLAAEIRLCIGIRFVANMNMARPVLMKWHH